MTRILDDTQHTVAERIDLPGVFADEMMLELVNGGFGGLDETVDGGLADAVKTFIGHDAEKKPVLPSGADCIGFDVRNFHARELLE